MPTVQAPISPYLLPQWQAEPKNKPAEVDGQPGYERYDYANGETLTSIALRISQPGETIDAGQIADLNWGTTVQGEINFYLRDHNGCKANTADTAYDLAQADRQPWLWVPRVRPKAPVGKFRSPGKNDVGHVAPTYQATGHINTLVVPPVYSITLELGDIDALYEEMLPMSHASEPWKHKRVLERLQALGYMYTPLGHSEAKAPSYWAAERAWRYFASVHDQKRGPQSNRSNASRMALLRGTRTAVLSNAELLAILKSEIQNNTVTRAFPASGVVFQNSKLPPPGEFGVIRFPGGFCFNSPRLRTSRRWTVTDVTPPSGTRAITRAPQSPTDADRSYDFELGDDRFRIEEAFLNDNPRIGKIPLVATVHQLLPDGRRIPAAGASVYFQLIDPAALDPGGAASRDYSAPVLRDTVMDYSKDWRMQDPTAGPPGPINVSIAKKKSPTATQWTALQTIAANVSTQHPTATPQRKQHIDGLPLPPELVSTPASPNDWTIAEFRYVMTEMAKHPAPYEISNAGQKRFMDRVANDIEQEAIAVDPNDPQRRNCPDRWAGKRSLPIPGNIFEITPRDGFHTPRPDHRDFGTLAVATAATANGASHKYAVVAKTNDKGHAGVIFVPSRCGGDAYRIRAYVGPETLEFDGTDAEGPVVETGTLVVWRNIRMHRYVQKPTPPTPWSAAVNTSLNYIQTGTHSRPGDPKFDAMKLTSPMIDVQVLTDDSPEPPYRRTDRTKIDTTVNTRGKRNYRPVGSQFLGLKDLLRRCYCELITDCHSKEVMESDELRDAIEAGIQALERDWDLPDRLIFRTLFYHDFSSPFMLNQRSFDEYNALVSAPTFTPPVGTPANPSARPAATLDGVLGNELVGFFTYLLVDTIGSYFSDGGAFPGLTLVQVPRSETWDPRAMNNGTVTTSGYGTPARSAFLSHTRDIYTGDEFCYSATSNAAHELGHCLALAHQEFYPGGDPDHHQPQPNKEFVKPTQDDCPCVLGYYGCYGEFCAKCLLALRGWKIKSQKNPSGV